MNDAVVMHCKRILLKILTCLNFPFNLLKLSVRVSSVGSKSLKVSANFLIASQTLITLKQFVHVNYTNNFTVTFKLRNFKTQYNFIISD